MPVSAYRKPSPLAAKIAASGASKATGKYLTTRDSCTCPDHQFRHHVCKHMEELRNPKPVQVSEEDAANVRAMEEFF